MESSKFLNVLGRIEDSTKNEVAEKILSGLINRYPDISGDAYLGYPIYIDEIANRRVCVDIALITRLGVYIINILTSSVTDYGAIQDDIYAKVESKFKKQPFLFKRKKLVFDFNVVTYTMTPMTEIDDCPLVSSVEEFLSFVDETKKAEPYSDDLYGKIISGIQEAYGINIHKDRSMVTEGTKAYAIGKMSSLIERYDARQMDAILSDTEGIQRIRGMAGSGKTIVLARKAVELHTAHPDWDIVVTYSTRTLKEQLTSLIERFYAAKNDGAKYNDKKLKVMQAWGSANSKGVYYEICLRHGVQPLNVTDAKRQFGNSPVLFSRVCGELLKTIDQFQKMYDCILIDEAQDFDKNYLRLCLEVLDQNKRLVYAYDELQKLNEEAMPDPKQIFGREIVHDTPLTVCYRNQGNAIVTAHAIGMGLYRKEGLIQLPSSSSVWEAIGYVSDKPIVEGEEVTLYRTKETSPELLQVNSEEIIQFHTFDDSSSMYKALLDLIKGDLEYGELTPKDLMVIDMDQFDYSKNRNNLYLMQMELNANGEDFDWDTEIPDGPYSFKTHAAGAASPEDFFREDSVVYSSIRRAKGNETFVVYIVNAQKCVNSLRKRSDRNGLFTAITRSKGWVHVLGYGEDMGVLAKEFDEIKKHGYKLHFDEYPTKEKLKEIFLNNRDISHEEVRTLDTTKQLIDKLTATEGISKLQLMQELFGMNREELLAELKKKAGED